MPYSRPVGQTAQAGGGMTGTGLQTLAYFVLLALILYTAGSGVQ
ncbi:hypothetical protein [Paragemmobacter kunshanensis]|nr:hypothetical protein [Rhodobacter kunshanensis]